MKQKIISEKKQNNVSFGKYCLEEQMKENYPSRLLNKVDN